MKADDDGPVTQSQYAGRLSGGANSHVERSESALATAKLGEFLEAGSHNRSNRRGGVGRPAPSQLAIPTLNGSGGRATLGFAAYDEQPKSGCDIYEWPSTLASVSRLSTEGDVDVQYHESVERQSSLTV